jgi:hypothetical protein
VEFINFKVRASLPERLIQFPKIDKKGKALDKAIKGKRKAYSPMTKDFIPYTVYDRYKLFPSAKFKGPAIIEEKESTVIVGEDTSVSVDDFGFLWIDILTAPESASMKKNEKRRVSAQGNRPKTSTSSVEPLSRKGKSKALARKKPKH